jgi:hypothetical protein
MFKLFSLSTLAFAAAESRPFPRSLAQPVEFPANRDQPDHFEYKEDYVAEAKNGPEGLTHDA